MLSILQKIKETPMLTSGKECRTRKEIAPVINKQPTKNQIIHTHNDRDDQNAWYVIVVK